jgi:hypothetical protein
VGHRREAAVAREEAGDQHHGPAVAGGHAGAIEDRAAPERRQLDAEARLAPERRDAREPGNLRECREMWQAQGGH